MFYGVIVWILLLPGTWSQDPQCCHRVRSHPACQEACDQMALESSSAGRRQHVGSLLNNCPMTLNPFWQCVNSSAPDIWQEDTGWPGRLCCISARSERCHAACMQAHTFSDVASGCVQSEEAALFHCLRRYEQRESCCSLAPSGTQCRNRCEAVFDHHFPGHDMSLDVEIFCTNVDRKIIQCVANYTKVAVAPPNPRDSLHCCEHSNSPRCRETCRRVHLNMTNEDNIMDALLAGCDDTIIPHHDMWKCFLLESQQQGSNSAEIGISNPSALDGARLQCCSRAVSPRCKEICVKLYSTSWSNEESWNEFDEHCQYQPTEGGLLTCLADVQEPCQPGCKGLDYCSNFNNRPAEMFRSCRQRADEGASKKMLSWREGVIDLTFMDIPVLDISACESDMWKAIACTIQVKPCDRKSHANTICKADCIHILSQCIDRTRLAKGITPEGLCTILSPTDDSAPCVSLDKFLVPSKYMEDPLKDVTFPCNPDPCNNETTGARGICTVDRTSCGFGEVCTRHKCSQGCRLGDASTFLVPQGSSVRLPDSTSNLGCYQSCTCGTNNMLEHCQPLRCEVHEQCRVSGQIKEHGAHYKMDCNTCVCFGGVETCSKRQCIDKETVTPEEKRRHTGLPCDCSDHYVPVCGANGQTYPNECLARCAAELLNDQFEFGSCASKDPCLSNPCKAGLRCLSKRQVCLSITYAECPQYECVPRPQTCSGKPYSPVCDADNKEHANMCVLLSKGKTLAYPTRCEESCSPANRKPVCGHNGHTYSSQCEAWAHRTTVDYYGPCQAIGKLTNKNTTPRCSLVTCPSPDTPNCIGVVPPGGCCPVCAGQTLVLYSEAEADRVAAALGNKAITMDRILPLLRNMVTAAECDLFGYLSIEGDIVLLVKPISNIATDIHIEVCNREAENLEALINSRSPTVVSFMHLSPLLAASTIMPAYNATSAAAETVHISTHNTVLLLSCSLLYQIYMRVR